MIFFQKKMRGSEVGCKVFVRGNGPNGLNGGGDFQFRSCLTHKLSLFYHRFYPPARVVKWQTRQLEGLVGATPWRFESSPEHQASFATTVQTKAASAKSARRSRATPITYSLQTTPGQASDQGFADTEDCVPPLPDPAEGLQSPEKLRSRTSHGVTAIITTITSAISYRNGATRITNGRIRHKIFELAV